MVKKVFLKNQWSKGTEKNWKNTRTRHDDTVKISCQSVEIPRRYSKNRFFVCLVPVRFSLIFTFYLISSLLFNRSSQFFGILLGYVLHNLDDVFMKIDEVDFPRIAKNTFLYSGGADCLGSDTKSKLFTCTKFLHNV